MPLPLTLGVEEEMHLIDVTSSRLAGRAPALLARLPPEHFSYELQRTTVETNTVVCRTLSELSVEIMRLRQQVVEVAAAEGLSIAAVGTVPLSSAGDFKLTRSGRFARMQADYRLLVDEQLICGTQVHVGVPDRDQAVLVAQRVHRDLPLLLALSASSPFWHGADTGYASFRSLIWARWPTSGMAGPMTSAAEYDDLLADLITSGVISDTKMAYFDVRPSAHVPTIELRVCDACPLVDDAILIAGLFRALVATALAAIAADEPPSPLAAPLHRAAMWRAGRSGLSGQLLDNGVRPRPVPAADAVRGLLLRMRPMLEDVGDWDTIAELAQATLARGNSASRQRNALAERGRLTDVVSQVVAETHGTAVEVTGSVPHNVSYRGSPRDEAFASGSFSRPLYRDIFAAVERIGPLELNERLSERDRWSRASGMTFAVGGDHRSFPVDLLPRVIGAHEWEQLTLGLAQRARALEMFLRDVYADGEVVSDGVVPAAMVYDSPGWRNEALSLPKGSVRAAVLGFDLVRDDIGTWRVLEDNARVPSGVGYALAIREMIDAVMPDLPRPSGLLPAHTAPGLLRRALCFGTTVADPVLALLSDGATSSAWFEHRLLAQRAGLLLVQPGELAASGGVITVQGRRVDVLYLRLDVELADLLDPAGRPIGAAIVEAAARGAVRLANAPGNGVADDKAMYCYVPDLIAYYLSERPLLEAVPTYQCRDPHECVSVLDRVGELVTKPVDGFGGGGVLIGPHATPAELAGRREEIRAEPSRWIGQEVVRLSSHPTLTGLGYAPRHVDLRAFVYLSGTGQGEAQVADLALTRVAAEGSMVVNSSRGGGAKDTWILGRTPESNSAVELSSRTKQSN
jgi:glutamate---cysteine ligase / carboxylate-amine ligase